MLVLDRDDVETLLSPGLCLEAIERVMIDLHEGRAVQPLRTVETLGERGSALFMPAILERPALLGTKVVTILRGNPALGVASHHAALLVFEAEHGRPVALIEGASVTALRTAATSALATRLLARPGARVLALLGSGVQARGHLDALLEVTDCSTVRVWSPREASRRDFVAAARERFPELTVEAAASAEEAVRGADVVTTVTSSKRPILEHSWLAPGCHVNAIGASTATTREIDTETVVAAALFVDQLEAALTEAGELLLPMAEGRLDASHVRGDLGALAAGEISGRTADDQLTLFKSVGLAVQDLAAAGALIGAATARVAGQVVDWV
jgi:ornithine cyclodeaminase